MAGRRQQQKERRRAAILRAASQLLEAHGYAGTSMSDVARRADLAVGTLYNYFASKPEIVLALVQQDVAEALGAGEAILKRPPSNPLLAVRRLLDHYLEPLARHDRALWRELVGAAMADRELGASFFGSDLRLVGQLAALLEELRARGDLRPELDSGRAAVVLYGAFFGWFMAYVTSESMSLAALRAEVRRAAGLVMHGLLERTPGRTSR